MHVALFERTVDTDTLLGEVQTFQRIWMETGGEAMRRPWGRIVRNLRYPRIHMANAGWIDRVPEGGIEAVLRDLDEAFDGTAVRHRYVLFRDPQEAFEQQESFANEGFQPFADLAMARLGLPVCISNPDLEMKETGSGPPPEEYEAVRRALNVSSGYDPEESEQLLALDRERAAALGAHRFLAYLHGRPAGTILLWTRGPFAFLEDVFTLPAFRMQGVARTMLFQASRMASRAGCEWTLLLTNLLDTPRVMYQTLGFVPIGEIRGFLRVRSPEGPKLM
jgi:GNAT superfamily N-acetyltransferase